MKILVLLFLSFGLLSYAETEAPDVRFLATQRSSSSLFTLPISVNTKGEISFSGDDRSGLSFHPTFMATYSRSTIIFTQPVMHNYFSFYPAQKDLGWIEVKRLRYEYGLGLSALLKPTFTFGLIPYRGAIQTFAARKTSLEEKSRSFSMPQTLSELEEWRVGDVGTFQLYGGVQVYVGFSAGMADVATMNLGIQNQFIVEMKRVSETEVRLTLSEEKLDRRQLVLGPFVAEGTLENFEGKRFSSSFDLQLGNPEHERLFTEALKGNLTLLQSKLPVRKQRLTWLGHDRQFYFGLPVLAGVVRDRGEYKIEEDGVATQLDFTGRRLRGILTPLRNYQDIVYQTDEGIAVLWTSEMKKPRGSVVDDRFLAKGRIIGAKGFQRAIPPETKFGSVISHIGVHFTKAELLALAQLDPRVLKDNLRNRCILQKLSCQKERKLAKMMSSIGLIMQKPWKDLRTQIGLLMLREPALIYAFAKSLPSQKEVYFRFLSEKFQSLEGSAPVEL